MRSAVAGICMLAACRFGFDAREVEPAVDASQSIDAAPAIDAAVAPWFGGSWMHRRRLTVDAAQVGTGGVTGFPLAVVLTDAHLQANARGDARDIVFTSADGTTKLPHEIERFNETLVAWVKLDLSATANTELFLYYGNSGASDQQAVTSVWDSGYRGVWHLAQSAGGPAAFRDSTSNANHASDSGGPLVGQPGRIGGAIAFDGVDDVVEAPNTATLRITGALTIECWMYLNDTVANMGTYPQPIAKWYGDAGGYSLLFNSSATYSIVTSDGSPPHDEAILPNTFVPGNWYHVVGTWSPAPGGTKTIWVDGVLRHSEASANSSLLASTDPGNTMQFGSGWPSPSFIGLVDEPRVSAVVRSPAWITTQHRNQRSPATFLAVAALETQP